MLAARCCPYEEPKSVPLWGETAGMKPILTAGWEAILETSFTETRS
jgi:hypothetical protein